MVLTWKWFSGPLFLCRGERSPERTSSTSPVRSMRSSSPPGSVGTGDDAWDPREVVTAPPNEDVMKLHLSEDRRGNQGGHIIGVPAD
jgi:hypothetical protein